MDQDRPYFFCGIGGSGMLPLALILRGKGVTVSGSDRAFDQGRTAPKFDFLRAQGIALFPQDGSGVSLSETIVVASAAVEETVPDIQAARRVGAEIVSRATLLADLFNAAPKSIGVAGTSGKSTTTGMIGWILQSVGRDPTIMNGAVMNNFVTAQSLFASSRVGEGEVFVSEVDESDGSIAQYSPRVAVVNNISLDHKSMDELRLLFRDFVGKARIAVLNLDNAETAALAEGRAPDTTITYSLIDPDADLLADDVQYAPTGTAFTVYEDSASVGVHLKVPGKHNISNALAALGAARAQGVALGDAARALERFSGIKRRLEIVGRVRGITVIDDFAHNPDKITATLNTLHGFPGRLLLMFQPHGYGPLAKMKNELIETFSQHLGAEDVLLMPEPVYFGGTTRREVTSEDIAHGVTSHNRRAFALTDRDACRKKLVALAATGDRIVVMGARDDTLSVFAVDLLKDLSA